MAQQTPPKDRYREGWNDGYWTGALGSQDNPWVVTAFVLARIL